LLTTDTTYIPTGFGPAESAQPSALTTTLTRTIVYTYDNLYRLTNATYSTGEVFTYTYDPAGNRKTQTTLAGTTVYTYDAANRLTQVDGQSYTWDNNGNLLSDGSRTFTYDTENRLTSVVSGGITSTFKYNGDGDRYAQTVNGITTDYVLDPVGLAQVLMETTGGQSKHYLPGLAQYDATNGWQYVTSDRVGSVRLLVKPNGEVALSQSFDPFGNVLERTGAGQSSFGYTGEQTDPTGLVFLRARYYDPRIGRFLTADSVVPDPLSSMGWNRYAYVGNNPVNLSDPSGHCPPAICQGDYTQLYHRSDYVADWQRKAYQGVTYEMYVSGRRQYEEYAADGYLYLQDKLIYAGIEPGDAQAALSRLQHAKIYAHLYADVNLDLLLPPEAFNSTVDKACATGDTSKIAAAYMLFLMVIGLSDHGDMPGSGGGGGSKPVSAAWEQAADVTGITYIGRKTLIKRAGLPTTGRIRYVPPKRFDLASGLPRGDRGYIDKFGNEWVRGPSRTPGEPYEWDVILSSTGRQQLGRLSKGKPHINVSLRGHITH
jgi:RHS repeat-associated protein